MMNSLVSWKLNNLWLSLESTLFLQQSWWWNRFKVSKYITSNSQWRKVATVGSWTWPIDAYSSYPSHVHGGCHILATHHMSLDATFLLAWGPAFSYRAVLRYRSSNPLTPANIKEWTGKKKSAEKCVQVCFFDQILETELQNKKKTRVKVSLNDPLKWYWTLRI